MTNEEKLRLFASVIDSLPYQLVREVCERENLDFAAVLNALKGDD